jgi:hypothetical protein
MAAGLGFKTFVTGDVLTAGDTNGYLMQGVWVFADAAARTAAVTSPQEGNFSFLKDTNSTEYYNGAAWVGVGNNKLIQVVFGSTATQTSNATTTYADTTLTATITPTLSSSKILVLVSQNGVLGTTASNGVKLRLLRAGSSIFEFAGSLGFTQASSTRNDVSGSCSYLDTPSTTSATTYKTQFAQRSSDGTAVQVQVVSESQSTITLIEIGA